MSTSTGLVSTIISYITEALESRRTIRAAITESTIESIKRGDISNTNIEDVKRAQAGGLSDLLLYVFLLPVLLSFYPPLLPSIMDGFKAMESIPQWWLMILGMMTIIVWIYQKLIGPIIQQVK